MRVHCLILLLCSAVLVSSAVVDRLQFLNATEKRQALSRADNTFFEVDVYGSVLRQLGDTPCPVPPSLVVQRDTLLLPDNTTPCFISTDDPADSQKQCQEACSQRSSVSDGSYNVGPSVICWALKYPDGDCEGQLITQKDAPQPGIDTTLGRCLCDVPTLDYAINWFDTVAMPDIGHFVEKVLGLICEFFWGIAKMAITDIISVIPEVGPITQEAWTLLGLITGLTNQANLTDIEIGNTFLSWFDPCGANTKVELQLFDLFDGLAGIAAGRGMPVGPRRPRRPPGHISIGPHGPMSLKPPGYLSIRPPHSPDLPKPSTAPSPAASPASRPTDSTPAPTSRPSSSGSSSNSQSTSTSKSPVDVFCLAKRGVGRQKTEAAWTNCNNGAYDVTTITSIIFGPQQSLVPKVCSAKWSHACAHYASVIAVSAARGWDKLTCQDFHGSHIGARKRPATAQWNREHKPGWYHSQWREEKECDRDEYPPVYFFADNNPVLADLQQLVRYIPAFDNRGAGNGVWGPFCWTEGLKDSKARIMNTPKSADFSYVNHKKTTVRVTGIIISVSHRPIFSISDWENFGNLNMQDWGLAENPCLPTGLIDDKYFALLGTDPTLTAGPNQATWSADYGRPPAPALTATAVRRTSWAQKILLSEVEEIVTDHAFLVTTNAA